ncbi:MAG: imidazole glycerol phosphate synthase subunit HisH [Sulfuricurvum sp.]|nr:imidazole glycerol phosphate synthase subunit HisH [Sulfuricurvum sp.]
MNFINKDILVLNIGIGNIQSVVNAINHTGRSCVTGSSKIDIDAAKVIIFPGVGAFGEAVKLLKNLGIFEYLITKLLDKDIYFLGICLGMQLLFEKSYEHGTHQGLALLEGSIMKMDFAETLPHVGWNNIDVSSNSTLFYNIEESSDFYFDHSYSAVCDSSIVSSFVDYSGKKVVASVEKDNIFGVQFHPEKSQFLGLKIIDNFLKKAQSA